MDIVAMCQANYNTHVQNPRLFGDIIYLLCPFIRVLNLAVYMIGALIIVMISYGAIKAVLAIGDPKGLQGAKLTWQWALFGGLAVLFAYAIIIIAMNLLGVTSSLTPTSILNRVVDALNSFIDNITGWSI